MEKIKSTLKNPKLRNLAYTMMLAMALNLNTGCDYFKSDPKDFDTAKTEQVDKIKTQESKNKEEIDKKKKEIKKVKEKAEKKVAELEKEIKDLEEANKDLQKKLKSRPWQNK